MAVLGDKSFGWAIGSFETPTVMTPKAFLRNQLS